MGFHVSLPVFILSTCHVRLIEMVDGHRICLARHARLVLAPTALRP